MGDPFFENDVRFNFDNDLVYVKLVIENHKIECMVSPLFFDDDPKYGNCPKDQNSRQYYIELFIREKDKIFDRFLKEISKFECPSSIISMLLKNDNTIEITRMKKK